MSRTEGDLRIRRTRQALHNALLALIEEKGFEAIIVQDIADRAMINRVTFYKHYRDKYDLLEQTMQEMLSELSMPVETLLHMPGDQAVYDALVRWFEQVARHTSFYRTMLGSAGNAAFAARLRAYLEGMVTQALARQPLGVPIAPLTRAVRIRFVAAGFLGVTEWWLEQKQPLSVQEAAAQLHWLLKTVTRGATEG